MPAPQIKKTLLNVMLCLQAFHFACDNSASTRDAAGPPSDAAFGSDLVRDAAANSDAGVADNLHAGQDLTGTDTHGLVDAATTDASAVSGWQARGVGGGGALFSPSLSLHDEDELYMTTDMGVFFYSQDFGRQWRGLDFRQLSGGSLAVVRFSSNPNVRYAIHQEYLRSLRKSDDAGATWQASVSNPCVDNCFYLHVDPHSSQRLLVSDYDKLYFSDDGGASFSTVFESTNASGLLVSSALWDLGTIYVASNDGFLTSNNGGAYFDLSTTTGLPANEKIAASAMAKNGTAVRVFALTLDQGDVYAGLTGAERTGFAGIYRLDVGQSNWQECSTGLPADQQFAFIAMAENDVDTVYVAGEDSTSGHPAVFKSGDAADSWNDVLLSEGNINIATGWAGYHGDTDWWWGGYALGFAVSPVNSDRLVLTDMGFVHVSDDGGAHWRQAYVRPQDQNPEGADTPHGRFYQTSGVEQTSGWWLTWASATTLFGSWTDIRSIFSMDAGQSWSRNGDNGLSLNTTYQARRHPQTGALYAVTSSKHDLYQSTYLSDDRIDSGTGALMISTDNGAFWQVLHDFGLPVVWLTFAPDDSNTLYVSVVHSSQGGIYVSHNLEQGNLAQWTRLANPPRTEGHPYNIVVLDDGSLLATYSGRRSSAGFTESSGLFVSGDGGQNWQDMSSAQMRRWTKDVVVDPHDASQNTWYVSVFSHWGAYPNEVGGLYRTRDRGAHFEELGDFFRVESCAIDPVDATHMYVATETEGLWETHNSQAEQPTFVPVMDYPFAHPMRIFFDPYVASQVWVTSFGGGLRVLSH